MKKRILVRGAVCATIAALLLGTVGCSGNGRFGNIFGSKEEESTEDGFDPNSERIKSKTEELEKFINSTYYFDVDEDKQEEAYFDGILEGLDDPYSAYYTKEEYEDLQEDNSGQYQGIGAVVSKDQENGQIYVVNPIKDSPAEKAGVLPGDVFVKVDDIDLTTDMELDYVVGLIRGDKGTTVHITFYREGEGMVEFDIVRDKVENVTVEYDMLDGKIGYIKVNEFIGTTSKQFKEAVDELQGKGAKGLIIDLRNNPGGLVMAAAEMCDYLVADDSVAGDGAEKGMIVYTKDKSGNVIDTYACGDKHSVDLPMVVLVNGNSASSSEIFTGCIKDYKKAVIVGTTTYGKGIVQIYHELSDGSAVKLTMAKYFTPAGNDIHGIGIEPDVEVELDEEQRTKITVDYEDDNQLQEALKQF